MPPTGMRAADGTLPPSASTSSWMPEETSERPLPIAHVMTYAQPPEQQPAWTDEYAWVQNNLQYTVKNVSQAANSLHFAEGGQQVNSYSWVLGSANIMNGSRFFVERLGLEDVDAPGEYFYDPDTEYLYVYPPASAATHTTGGHDGAGAGAGAGAGDAGTNGEWWVGAEIIAATLQRVVNIRGAGVSGVAPPGKRDKSRVVNVTFADFEIAYTAGRKSSLSTKNLLEVTDGLRRPP